MATKSARATHRGVNAPLGTSEKATGKGVKAIQEYLTRFGYLAEPHEAGAIGNGSVQIIDPRPHAEPGEFDAATTEALREFQRMSNLPETGEFDEATRDMTAMPRCGNTDVRSFVATGGRWPSNNLTYAFSEFSPDLTPAQCRQAVHQAFSTWAGWTPLTFREGPAGSAQIIIRFVTGNHGDGFPFDGANGVLAHAFFPPVPPAAPTAIQGDTHFDEAETWTLNVPTGASQFDLTTVALHEFGHALGLNHSPVAGAVMQAFYGGPRRVLHNDDVSGVTSIYGGYDIAEASWVHGTSIQVEVPENLESVRRFGFFTRIIGKPNTTNWLHFAIPTPVIVNNVRKTFGPCMLRFSTGGTDAMVRDVHLYDGEARVAAHDSVNLSGSQGFTRFGVAHAPKVLWGVGISIGVRFGASSSAAARTMDFISAGCDFRP
jgi:hypothetical protein